MWCHPWMGLPLVPTLLRSLYHKTHTAKSTESYSYMYQRNIFKNTLAPVSVFSFSLERWDKMAVQSLLLHTTASPVCMWLGSVSALNLTAITLVSACLVVLPFTPPNRTDQHIFNSSTEKGPSLWWVKAHEHTW